MVIFEQCVFVYLKGRIVLQSEVLAFLYYLRLLFSSVTMIEIAEETVKRIASRMAYSVSV